MAGNKDQTMNDVLSSMMLGKELQNAPQHSVLITMPLEQKHGGVRIRKEKSMLLLNARIS